MADDGLSSIIEALIALMLGLLRILSPQVVGQKSQNVSSGCMEARALRSLSVIDSEYSLILYVVVPQHTYFTLRSMRQRVVGACESMGEGACRLPCQPWFNRLDAAPKQ